MPLADINDPSNITDFGGFVGLTRVRGGGVGTNTVTGATADLAFQVDMGFNQGHLSGRMVDYTKALSPLFDSIFTPVQLDRLTSLMQTNPRLQSPHRLRRCVLDHSCTATCLTVDFEDTLAPDCG